MNKQGRGLGTPGFTLIDAGPLVSLINVNDPYFEQAKGVLRRLPKAVFRTTWPCLTEAMYLLHRAKGYAAQAELWRFVEIGLVQLHMPSEEEWRRMRELMAEYRDTPMDFADASLVAAAEELSVAQVFSFDRHFHAYRTKDGGAFDVVP